MPIYLIFLIDDASMLQECQCGALNPSGDWLTAGGIRSTLRAKGWELPGVHNHVE